MKTAKYIEVSIRVVEKVEGSKDVTQLGKAKVGHLDFNKPEYIGLSTFALESAIALRMTYLFDKKQEDTAQ